MLNLVTSTPFHQLQSLLIEFLHMVNISWGCNSITKAVPSGLWRSTHPSVCPPPIPTSRLNNN